MKKNNWLILLSLMFIFPIFSCASNNSSESLEEYEYIYNPTFEDEFDDFITLDGKLDEIEWSKQNRLYYSEKGIDFEYTTIFTTKGLFVGCKAYDKKITYYGRYDMKHNSGFTIRITRPDVSILQQSEIMRLEVDAYDRRSFNQDRFAAKTYVEGEIDSNNTMYMSSEMFVTWKELGFKNVKSEEDIPNEVKIIPCYRYVQLLDDDTRILNNLVPSFSEPDFLRTYYPFNKNGYAIKDIEGCALGNAKNGNTRTIGWDLSEYGNGKVTSTEKDSQALYFTDVMGKNFVVESQITLNSSLGTSNNPRFGLIVHGTEFQDFRSLSLKGNINNDKYWEVGTLRINALTYRPYRRFNEVDGIFQELNSPLILGTNNLIKVKMIKCDKTLLFFVEDKLVYSETHDWFTDQVCPGLYTMDCSATFTNYYANEISDEDLDKYFNLYSISRIDIPTSFRGGNITSNISAINKGDEFKLVVKPNIGYYLSSLTINDKDFYEEYCEDSYFGEFTVKDYPIKESTKVDAIFSKYDRNSSKMAYGTLISSTDNKSGVPSADINITSSFNWLYFIDKTSSKGAYLFDYLPAKGTKLATINGIEYVADGYYDVKFETNGYQTLNIKYYVDEDGYHYDGPDGKLIDVETDITMICRKVGGVVSSSNFVYTANTEKGWDLSNEHNDIVVANRGSSNVPLHFTNIVSKQAVIDLTVQDAAPDIAGYDSQPSMGISFQTGGYYLAIMVDGTKVRILPRFEWYNDSEHLIEAKHIDGTNVFNTTSNQKIDLRIIRDNDLVAMLAKTSSDVDYTLVYSGKFSDLFGLNCAYGLYSRSSGLVNNIFSNYAVNTDEEYVQTQIDNYLMRKYELDENGFAKVAITDNDGQPVDSNGCVAGTRLNVTVTADANYYVDAVIVNGDRVKLTYKDKEQRIAIANFALLNDSNIEIIIIPSSEKPNSDLDCSLHGTGGKNSVSISYDENSQTNRGLYYLTSSNINSNSLERSMYIQTRLTTNDLSGFKYIDFELFEGGAGEKMIPYIVLPNGETYKLGGTNKNYWSATRYNNNSSSIVSSNGQFLGLDVGHGQAKSTYRFDLSNGASFDQTITNALGNAAISGTYNYSNVYSLGVQTYAASNHKWSFGLIAIYGINENGEKTLLFDGKQANIKQGISGFDGLALLNDANDVYLWNVIPAKGDSKNVNYQSLKVLGTGVYQINYGGSTNSYDMYSWMKITVDNTSEKLINLYSYDGFSFDLDTTHESIKNKEYLSGEFEFRYSSSASGSRPAKIYLIDLEGNITTVESSGVCNLPTNFKGKVVILFEDLTHISSFAGNETIVCSEFRFIVNTTDMDGCLFNMSNLKFIQNGSELVKG